MKTNRPRKPVSRKVVSNAKQVLAFAEEFAKHAKFGSELFNAIYGPGAKASEFFSTEAERREFLRTKERKQISDLISGLPSGPFLDEVYEIDLPNKQVTIRRGSKVISVQPIVD